LQFAATTTRAICRLFQLLALGRSFFGRTFNPKVAGSIPARPTTKYLQIGDSFSATFEENDPGELLVVDPTQHAQEDPNQRERERDATAHPESQGHREWSSR
jgi:hypothetical protein